MQFYINIPYTFPGGVTRTFDLIVPDGNASEIPLLVWIHGGGWCGGEKRIFNDFERFVFHGCAVLSIDYRLSQDAPFPAQLEDCKTAIRWARANAEKYGYSAERVIIGGSSAGGHLAALVGLTNGQQVFDVGPYMEYSSCVQAVVDLFGPADLRDLPTLQKEIDTLVCKDVRLTEQASPICWVCENAPDFLIVHGQKDTLVPVVQSRRLKEALCNAGNCVDYLEIPDGLHGFDSIDFYNALTSFIISHIS